MSRPLVLVLGGTRSGKSRFGLERARSLAGTGIVTFLATARPGDPELDRRIEGHRSSRPSAWPTREVGDDLAGAIQAVEGEGTILLDGLTLWVSGAWEGHGGTLEAFLDGPLGAALVALDRRRGPVVIVSDEIGLGLVPMDASAREFRDLMGIAHQRIAAAADEVYLLVAGLPMALKVT